MSDKMAKESGKRRGEEQEGPESQKKSKSAVVKSSADHGEEVELDDDFWAMFDEDDDDEVEGDGNLDWLDGGLGKPEEVVKKAKDAEKMVKDEKERLERAEKREKEQERARKLIVDAKKKEDEKRKEAEETRKKVEKANEEKRRLAAKKEQENEEARRKAQKLKWDEDEKLKLVARKKREEEERQKEWKRQVDAAERLKMMENKKKVDEEKKKTEEAASKKEEKKQMEDIAISPAPGGALQKLRDDQKTLAASRLFVQHTIRTLEEVSNVLHEGQAVTSTEPSRETAVTLLNFCDTRHPSQARHVLIRMLAREGIRCAHDDISLLTRRSRMPRISDDRFFVTASLPPHINAQITRVFDAKKVMYEDRLREYDVLDNTYIVGKKMSVNDVVDFEMLRFAAEAIAASLPFSVRLNIRYDGTGIFHPHRTLQGHTVSVSVDSVWKDWGVVNRAEKLFNKQGRFVLSHRVGRRNIVK